MANEIRLNSKECNRVVDCMIEVRGSLDQLIIFYDQPIVVGRILEVDIHNVLSTKAVVN